MKPMAPGLPPELREMMLQREHEACARIEELLCAEIEEARQRGREAKARRLEQELLALRPN
jgi:hypothetical protein